MKTNALTAHITLETFAPRILALGLLAVLLLLALTGCKSVPCNLTHEDAAMVVKSGSLTFNADGTCRSFSIFSLPPHPDIQREVNATCTQNGAELTLRWNGAGITQGQLHGDTFTMNNEGMIFCYRK